MSVDEIASGVAQNHVVAIERQMLYDNCFVILRKTEYDSTMLIKGGFATKSMDIHAKSSNWGPMAGMVPLDPAFSKKRTGQPNQNFPTASHGAAITVPLSYSFAIFQDLYHRGKFKIINRFELFDHRSKTNGREYMVRSCEPGIMNTLPDFKYYFVSEDKSQDDTIFCVIVGPDNIAKVYWVKFPQGQQNIGTLYPVLVWGYNIDGLPKPVTGDYDIWMVAPYYKDLEAHSSVVRYETPNGTSSATPYITALIDRLNDACNRTANRVFQHGAEAQNIDFTQQLDESLVLFTPGAQSRMIHQNDLPALLKEMLSFGYLVCGNPQYARPDPMIQGAAWHTNHVLAEQLLDQDRAYVNRIKQAAMEDSAGTSKRNMSRLADEHHLANDKTKGVHDMKYTDGVYRSLLQVETPMTRLSMADLPSGAIMFEKPEIQRLAHICDRIARGENIPVTETSAIIAELDIAKIDKMHKTISDAKRDAQNLDGARPY
ncbi:Calmodulin-sensitive adenylate cyclase [BD1-7 clade bacterium]|uniref:Calmodulin-sensitive adenylate cyclase n=1 Tax=BD1-7 clade bacterium TaxID=2029982 RepID=A0A5S9QQ48_9GAMM|nr:Calmodulin-sensitive adenylate cyclase [BD1-7 clade bacterium]